MAGVVLSGPERRRRWSQDEKFAIVAETLVPGVSVRDVMDRHGLAGSLIYTWRKQARLGLFEPMRSAAFAPVAVVPSSQPMIGEVCDHHPSSVLHAVEDKPSCRVDPCSASRIEIELGPDVRVLVGPDIDRSALEIVLGALQAVGR
jgi:transposase